MLGKAKYGEDRFVKIGEYTLHYVDAGKGEPLILVPGSFCTYRAWNRMIPLLSDSYRLLALDYLGTGDSDKPKRGFRYTIEEQAGSIARMIESLGIGPANLIGASYGGAIVLYLAAVYPQVVKRVFSIEGGIIAPNDMPSGGIDSLLKYPIVGDLFIWLAKTGLANKLFMKVIAGKWYPTMTADDKRDMLELIYYNARSASRIPWHWIAASPQNCSPDFAQLAKSIKVPLLYLYGEDSDFMDTLVKANVKYIHTYLPHARVIGIPGGTHDLDVQKPAEVARLVKEFFS